MSKPIAVIAGDIHYSLNNLKLADNGTRQAIKKANELGIPFISNGDLSDTKAILRAECVNAMIETFKTAIKKPFIITGNHDLCNAAGKEHSLNFLAPYANIINEPEEEARFEAYLIPYFHDVSKLRDYLKTIPKESRLIMHQGLQSASSGEYIQDNSALNTEDLKDFRTILSHYHTRQDIKCGRPRKNQVGTASYIGNLFTVSFAEHDDPPKGYQILYSDGSLEFIPTNLRKHVIWDLSIQELTTHDTSNYTRGDLLWVKVRGIKSELYKYTKKDVAIQLGIDDNFKLDLIPEKSDIQINKNLTKTQLLDTIIDNTKIDDSQKQRVKRLWRSLS